MQRRPRLDLGTDEPTRCAPSHGFGELARHPAQHLVARVAPPFPGGDVESLLRGHLPQLPAPFRIQTRLRLRDGEDAQPVVAARLVGPQPFAQFLDVCSLRTPVDVAARMHPGGPPRIRPALEGHLDQTEWRGPDALRHRRKTEHPLGHARQPAVGTAAVPRPQHDPASPVPAVVAPRPKEGGVRVPRGVQHQRRRVAPHVGLRRVALPERLELFPHPRLVAGLAATEGQREPRLVCERALGIGL